MPRMSWWAVVQGWKFNAQFFGSLYDELAKR